MTRILLCLFVLTACLAAHAQTSSEKSGKEVEQHIKQAPDFEITGDGSAAEWKTSEWIPIAARNSKTPYHANAKLLYSTKGIYCLYACEDRKITATRQADFTDLYNEDVVEIFFWPDEAFTIYFEYELSPTNYELAILVPNLKGNAYGWRPWNYEGKRSTRHATKVVSDDKGVASWTAEFFIPFSLLKPLTNTPPQKGTRWRANMYRIDYDDGPTYFSWQPTKGNFHEFEKYGTLIFD